MTTAVQDSRPIARAVRKIKCAATVNGLTRRWQSWVNERLVKQDAIPTGWVPDSILEDERMKEAEPRPAVVPQANKSTEDDEDDSHKIKTSAVTKTITLKRSDCGNDLVSFIKEKIDSNRMAPEREKLFLGGESPTRRRHCGSKASAALKAWSQVVSNERRMESRSSSPDTEDSGLGEDAPLSDHGDGSKKEPEKKNKSRPKVKVTTMGDLRSRWQTWADQHIEGQKLNPFSEEFDYEHAMSVRLQRGDAGYGRPKEGSKTAERAHRAEKHIRREMEEMCFIIRDMGVRGKDGRVRVTFGRLFDRYVKISDKVVGILLRCRKHGMVEFEGEMLWQGRDDGVVITLVE